MGGYLWEAGDSITADRLGEEQFGTVSITLNAATNGSAVVNFPEPFTAMPTVTGLTVVSPAGAAVRMTAFVTALSAASMTVRIDASAAVSGTFPVHWECKA